MNPTEEEFCQVNLRLSRAERDAVRDITKVDAAATGVLVIVRQRIEAERRNNLAKEA